MGRMSAFVSRAASRASSVFGFCFRLLFGSLAVIIGVAIILWVCYNLFIERQPEFTGSSLLPSFGIGAAMVAVSVYWLRRLRRATQNGDTHDA